VKKLSVFGAFRFSEFRIRDCVPVFVCTEDANMRCEISSSHGGEYEAQNLLGCTAVWWRQHIPLKRRSTFK
jgi:hypothetical protein